jgi:hypothetical protein
MRVAATTAVVAGTAGAVSHHQQQKYAGQQAEQQAMADEQAMQQQLAAQQAQIDAMQAQQAPAPAPAPAPAAAPAAAPADDMMAQLTQLSQLHNAGVLTDEEFAAAKAKLLA